MPHMMPAVADLRPRSMSIHHMPCSMLPSSNTQLYTCRQAVRQEARPQAEAGERQVFLGKAHQLSGYLVKLLDTEQCPARQVGGRRRDYESRLGYSVHSQWHALNRPSGFLVSEAHTHSPFPSQSACPKPAPPAPPPHAAALRGTVPPTPPSRHQT